MNKGLDMSLPSIFFTSAVISMLLAGILLLIWIFAI